MAALVLLVAGATLALLGMLPLVGLEAKVSLPEAVVAAGLVVASVGAWIVLYRPGEIVIDRAAATIRIRGPIRERRFSFRDVSFIELQPSQQESFACSLPTPQEERYDVGLRITEGTHLVVHFELELSTARMAAMRLAKITGRPVLRG
jgi:hypothetical protein